MKFMTPFDLVSAPLVAQKKKKKKRKRDGSTDRRRDKRVQKMRGRGSGDGRREGEEEEEEEEGRSGVGGGDTVDRVPSSHSLRTYSSAAARASDKRDDEKAVDGNEGLEEQGSGVERAARALLESGEKPTNFRNSKGKAEVGNLETPVSETGSSVELRRATLRSHEAVYGSRQMTDDEGDGRGDLDHASRSTSPLTSLPDTLIYGTDDNDSPPRPNGRRARKRIRTREPSVDSPVSRTSRAEESTSELWETSSFDGFVVGASDEDDEDDIPRGPAKRRVQNNARSVVEESSGAEEAEDTSDDDSDGEDAARAMEERQYGLRRSSRKCNFKARRLVRQTLDFEEKPGSGESDGDESDTDEEEEAGTGEGNTSGNDEEGEFHTDESGADGVDANQEEEAVETVKNRNAEMSIVKGFEGNEGVEWALPKTISGADDLENSGLSHRFIAARASDEQNFMALAKAARMFAEGARQSARSSASWSEERRALQAEVVEWKRRTGVAEAKVRKDEELAAVKIRTLKEELSDAKGAEREAIMVRREQLQRAERAEEKAQTVREEVEEEVQTLRERLKQEAAFKVSILARVEAAEKEAKDLSLKLEMAEQTTTATKQKQELMEQIFQQMKAVHEL